MSTATVAEAARQLETGLSAPLGASVEAGGLNFSVFSRDATLVELLLFDDGQAAEPAAVLPLDSIQHRTYHYWHAFVPSLGAGQTYAYRADGPFAPERGLRFDRHKILLDPYGLAVAVPDAYDRQAARRPGGNAATAMKSVVADPGRYDWEGDRPLHRPFAETVVYELHVRGFTRHPTSGAAPGRRGTYAGLIDKIPYLVDLGVTAVELLPVFQFDPQDAPSGRINYWGYQPVSYFAPHHAYGSRPEPLAVLDEFRDMVKALHRAGIEVILDVVFNHTTEGDETGPTLCYRGLANDFYYVLDQDRSRYTDYTGCGNTLNANQPIVRRLIQDSLRYWVTRMHVDGFRFDLASILSRDEAGRVLPNPPVLWDIESDPLLAGTKLIAEAWDAAGLYQVGSFVGDSWQEWNGRFRDDVRRFVRAENRSVSGVATRLLGSPNIYGHEQREAEQSLPGRHPGVAGRAARRARALRRPAALHRPFLRGAPAKATRPAGSMTPAIVEGNAVEKVVSPEAPPSSDAQDQPLTDRELALMNAYWRACNYLSVGMIYLKDNPLLREPLTTEHVKHRLLGHWGASPALSFVWVHLNRLIVKKDLDVIFVAGPGHGAPGVLGPAYLEGTYSEIYPDKTEDAEGMQKFFKQFSFPGHIGSHVTPETPGSIHEGGELGYSLSHAYGMAFDNPELIVACVVGDGEAETGPLATAWHSNKFLNPMRDGAVLPILNLNGYKIANPSVLSRISHEELQALFVGYGYTPIFVEGSEPAAMHQKMAAALDRAIAGIRREQGSARASGRPSRPRWPMIVLRSPKGWTGPKEIKGHKVEGSWRSHQVPFSNVRENPENLALLEDWLRSYKPEELFDPKGRLIPELRALAPRGARRMSANLHANGGLLRTDLKLPDIRQYAVDVPTRGTTRFENTKPLGEYLRDVVRNNPTNFRVFGPDETASNRLHAVFEASKKTWMADMLPEDADGGELAPDGRVMEILSEHTLIGWQEGYLLTGRHGFFHTYEAFAHVIDSMINQHAKWLDISKNHVSWRAPVASENILLSSTVWRQDHNGFSHQDPGFIDLVTNKSPSVTRVYLPADANTLLAVADHCLRSTDYVNVIVADKQKHLQFTTIEEAAIHCAKGLGIWARASTDAGEEPDVVLASCGDVATMEALAAAAILRERLPDLKVRFVNVVDLFKLQPASEHPHGSTEREFDGLFTTDKPIIFNFHGYPWLIHKLAYRFKGHDNLHVRGYKEKGNINTPLELVMLNETSRFHLVIDVIDRVPKLRTRAAHLKEDMRNAIIDNLRYAHEHGTDRPELADWVWPY